MTAILQKLHLLFPCCTLAHAFVLKHLSLCNRANVELMPKHTATQKYAHKLVLKAAKLRLVSALQAFSACHSMPRKSASLLFMYLLVESSQNQPPLLVHIICNRVGSYQGNMRQPLSATPHIQKH